MEPVWPSILTALLMGLAGAGHCLSMCGGIVAAVSISSSPESKRVYTIAYSLGRVSSYALMGALIGSGVAMGESGDWPVARTLAAFMLFILGLYFWGWKTAILRLESSGKWIWRYIQPLSRPFMPANTLPKAILLGAVWGWLPCGLVYSALVYSAAQGDAFVAALCMLAFGMGTVPALLFGGAIAEPIQKWMRSQSLSRVLGCLYIILSVWTAYSAWSHSGHHHSQAIPNGATEAVDHLHHH